jgi:peptidoglycan/LPS O-acetylase OafA/YrhL
MIAVSQALSIILIAEGSVALSKGYYSFTALGIWATWIVGMPSWLAGCWLAENYGKFRVLSRTSMRAVRCLIFTISVMVSILHFHIRGPWASNAILLSLFAAPATLWMGFEISYFKVHNPWPWLERAGLWSYSLYLAHPLFAGFIFMKYPTTGMPRLVLLSLCLVASYVFYLLIEWPSHKLAQAAGRSILFNRVAGKSRGQESKA